MAGSKLGRLVGPMWLPRRPEHPKKAEAKRLYDLGWGHSRIAREIDVPRGTVYGWTITWVRPAEPKAPKPAPRILTSVRTEESIDEGWMA